MVSNESALRTAFDCAANTIDAIAINNPVNAWMRNECRRELLALYPERSTLIEIGCGTGADAVFLAERGIGSRRARPCVSRKTRPGGQRT